MSAVPISIVIPTYNRAEVLGRALRSALEQSLSAHEVIVVDDGSHDGSADLLRRTVRDPRLRYVYQPNQGRCVARNRGAEEAAGEFLLFLDSDDELLSSAIDTFWRLLSHPSNPDLVCCADEHRSAAGQFDRTDYPENLGLLYHGMVANYQPGAFVIRKKIFQQLGGYRPHLELCEGAELFLRISERWRAGQIRVVNATTPVVIIYEYGRSMESNPARLARAVETIISAHDSSFRRCPSKLAQYCRIAGVASARAGQHRQAIRFFARAIQAAPWHPTNYAYWMRAVLRLW